MITDFFESLIKRIKYVKQPNGLKKCKGTSCVKVCHLLKALYSLKPSSRKWYLTLVDYLKSLCYKRLEHDQYVLVYLNGIMYYNWHLYRQSSFFWA